MAGVTAAPESSNRFLGHPEGPVGLFAPGLAAAAETSQPQEEEKKKVDSPFGSKVPGGRFGRPQTL